jgi:hypothetical protein
MLHPKKRLIGEEYAARIAAICLRLRESINEIQIINWLENFQEDEWDMALTVLESLKYFTIADIIYEFDENLKRILVEIPADEKLYLHGLGEFGKSGSSLIYYVKETPTFKKNEGRFKILSHIKKLKQQGLKQHGYLLLVDDIIGSGKSLTTYFNHNIKQQLVKENLKINTIVLCLAYMQDSVTTLIEAIKPLKIYGTSYKKAFASGSSVFGYRPKMLPIRQFCYTYGIDLFKLYDEEKKEVVSHPLGFNKSQSLIVFAHSVPNNTLPIIWSSKNNWYPLFPRNAAEKISQAKEFRNETHHWLNVAYKLNILKNNDPQNKIYYNDINYKVLAIMRLKRRRSIDTIICQIIGITANELHEALMEGVNLNIFDSDFNLTGHADTIYKNIKQKIQISNTQERRRFNRTQNTKIYVPKVFLGKA